MTGRWQDRAACRGNTTRFFLEAFIPLAVGTCRLCPVQTECLTHCLATEPAEHRYGIVGGLTPTERTQAARKQRAYRKGYSA